MTNRAHRLALLIAGDIAALAAFGAVGLVSHDEAVTAGVVARVMLPFPLAWLLVAALAGAFSARAVDGRYPVASVLLAWAAAGALGMAGRALVFDRALFSAFFVIGIAGGGLFLGAWRAIYNWWAGRSARSPSEVTLGRRT
jgi:hypothetical protein